jgi:hypothetical protein
MTSRSCIVVGCLILGASFLGLAKLEPLPAQQKKGLKTLLKSAFKGQHAWTVDEALAQLQLYPKDAYLQYVAMQLASRERRLDEVAGQVEMLLSNEAWQERNERVRRADLFSIFSGALAVQESMQLDSMRPQGAAWQRPAIEAPPQGAPMQKAGDNKGAPVNQPPVQDPAQAERARRAARLKERVNINILTGPTIKSHPWQEMLAGKKPEISPLAYFVPEDFYFVEFRSLNKLLEAMDVSELWGKHLFHQATQEARTQQIGSRLKTQLVVETNRLLRPVYDLVVSEVAVAGSDLFVAEGTDLTLLFRFKQPEVFKARMDGFLANAEKARPDAKRSTGAYLGIEYVHLATPDRAVCVYSAYPTADLHVRSNSLTALQRILGAVLGKSADGSSARRLGDTKEFAYIRTLMPRGAKEEDGFVYLSDPFIRRLVSPQVKLTERRRMLCYNQLRMIGHAALLYRTEQGKPPNSLATLAQTQCAPGLFGQGDLVCPDGGKFTLSDDGMSGVCSRHGHIHGLTPCCEIGVAEVNGQEADEYKAFLQEYNQYWRTFFDPIALRIQMTPQRYRLETIVLPLIDNSIYTGLAHVLRGKAEPLDGLPVPKRSIFSMALRLNKSELLAEAGLAPAEPEKEAATKPEGARASDRQCANNLKQIGLALHNYHDVYARLPAVANFDKQGKPLLSWRVHLLPYLDEGDLYKQFHLDEPWDSEHNKPLIVRMPAIYRCPNEKVGDAGKTTYLAPVYDDGKGGYTSFRGGPETNRFPASFPDGLANTIFVVDAADDRAVSWTKPDDLKYDPNKPRAGLAGHHVGRYATLFVDGSIHFLPDTIDDNNLNYLFLCADGHMVNMPGNDRIEVGEPRGDPAFSKLPFNIEERLKLGEFLSKGLGNQVGLHVYDAVPLVDFNMPGFFGLAMGTFNGRRGIGSGFFGLGSEAMMIGALIAALNAPVYISLPVQDARIVDEFLTRLDTLLVELSRQGGRNAFFNIAQDFYHLPLDKEKTIRAYAIQFGPLKWRFFWGRIGTGLYIASKGFILEDLLALEAARSSASKEPMTVVDHGPVAHAALFVRPQNWNQVLPDYRLGWAENNRQACLDNLGPLSSVARAVTAKSSGQSAEETAGTVHERADRLYGVHMFCPEGGHYVVAADGKTVTCSVHGSAQAPKQRAAPSEDSASTKLMREFAGMKVGLTFLEDGLHAVVTIDRK